MRGVIQRVKQASVSVENQLTGSIGKGLLVLVGVTHEDTDEDIKRFVSKVSGLRLWPDESGAPWKKSVIDMGGQILCVSQFTLYGRLSKGTKPDFHLAAGGEAAKAIYDKVKHEFGETMPNGDSDIADGIFGAMMDVSLVNDGPVTLTYDTKEKR